jgi:signal transduction histidine kinase
MNDLGKALLEKVDDIIETWVAEVRRDMEIESTQGMTYEAIHNGLPKVLEAVATLLTSAFASEEAELEETALEHGAIRAEQGFDVAEVVREYRTLRKVVVTALEPDLKTGSVSEVLKALSKIDEVLDDVVMHSVQCYVEYRISLLDKMHAQLLLSNQELIRLVQLQKDNVSHLAHELKNPLSAIIAFSSILLRKQQQQLTEESPQPIEMQQVERILHNGKQLLKLINNTLEVSRTDAEEVTLKLESVPVAELIRTVVEALEPSLQGKPITLAWNCDRAPKTVITDSLRLQQILTNLISNAIRYTDSGSVNVTCYTCDTADASEQWALAVSDTGRGISTEHQPKIFGPYFRVGEKEDYLPESNGLGLSVVSKLVQLLQGNIELESALGEGSNFVVRLPLRLKRTQ